ncbi:MAG: GNAT family N-acetyltransferase [Cyclobacteriaceae bacterium]
MLQTSRLLIEHATIEDREFIFELLNSPNWLHYIGDRGIRTIEDAEYYIEHSLVESYQNKGYGLYKVSLKGRDKPIGLCGFLKRDYLPSVDIGFAILPEFERQGYITEAAKAVLTYGKTKLGFSTVFGITSPDNTASQHLLNKLGLRLVDRRAATDQHKELLIFSDGISDSN